MNMILMIVVNTNRLCLSILISFKLRKLARLITILMSVKEIFIIYLPSDLELIEYIRLNNLF